MDEANDKNISALREEIKKDFSPITPIIYTVLETAQSVVPECIELFNKRCGNDSPDAGKIYQLLHPSLMRAIMQILLNSKNLKTRALLDHDDLPSGDWERIILSNNGLAGRYAERNYRLLKALKAQSLEEKLPPPGASYRKKEYYCQKHLMQSKMKLFPTDTVNEVMQKHNVIYLWDNLTNSVSLYLACPKWGTNSKAGAYFIEPVEHPVLSVPPVRADEVIQELDLEKLRHDINIVLNGDTQDESNENDSRE